MTATTVMLDAALDYAAHSYPVFPLHYPAAPGHCSCGRPDCDSPAKHPLTPHGLSDATCDARQIRAWWEKWPRANIGLAVPKHIVILDVDGTDGMAALLASSFALPPTATAQTARGHHYVYRSPVPVPPAVGILPHVDVRGPGSYVVAAPSVHITGAVYEWQTPLSEATEAPPWLVARAKGSAQVALPTGLGTRGPVDTARILDGIAEGQRDIELFRLASKLRHAGVPYEIAVELVGTAAARCTPPFPPALALTKVLSAYGRYEPSVHDTPEGIHVDILGEDSVRVILTSAMGPVEVLFTEMEKGSRELKAEMCVGMLIPGLPTEPYRQQMNILSASARESCRRELDAIFGKDAGWTKVLSRAVSRAEQAYLDRDRAIHAPDLPDVTSMQWTVGAFAPADGMSILFGAGSSAKTYIALDMALALANGLPWNGRVTTRCNVLWVDYETGTRGFSYRLRRVLAGNPEYRKEGLYYWPAEGIALPDQVEALRRHILRHDIGYLFVDHITVACGGRPEDAEVAARYGRTLGKLNIPSLHIAHITGEAERDISQTMRPFGSIFWKNIARTCWFIHKAPQQQGDPITRVGLFNRKNNDGPPPGDFGLDVLFTDPDGPVAIVPAELLQPKGMSHSRVDPDEQTTKWIIWDVLEHAMTVEEIMDATGLSEGSVRVTLNKNKDMFRNIANGLGGRNHKGMWERIPEYLGFS